MKIGNFIKYLLKNAYLLIFIEFQAPKSSIPQKKLNLRPPLEKVEPRAPPLQKVESTPLCESTENVGLQVILMVIFFMLEQDAIIASMLRHTDGFY